MLATSRISNCCNQADILPSLLGSDHCPIFADFTFSDWSENPDLKSLPFPDFDSNGPLKYVWKTNTNLLQLQTSRGQVMLLFKNEFESLRNLSMIVPRNLTTNYKQKKCKR